MYILLVNSNPQNSTVAVLFHGQLFDFEVLWMLGLGSERQTPCSTFELRAGQSKAYDNISSLLAKPMRERAVSEKVTVSWSFDSTGETWHQSFK